MRWPGRVPLVAALAPLGVVSGHVVGYGLAGQQAALAGTHTHLGPLGWIGLALTALVMAWVGLRPEEPRIARRSWLVGIQLSSFLCLEAAEHLLAGRSIVELAAEPSLYLGLVAQVATAGLLVLAIRLARSSGQRLRALMSGRVLDMPAANMAWQPISIVRRSLVVVSSASQRGPPRRVVSV